PRVSLFAELEVRRSEHTLDPAPAGIEAQRRELEAQRRCEGEPQALVQRRTIAARAAEMAHDGLAQLVQRDFVALGSRFDVRQEQATQLVARLLAVCDQQS